MSLFSRLKRRAESKLHSKENAVMGGVDCQESTPLLNELIKEIPCHYKKDEKDGLSSDKIQQELLKQGSENYSDENFNDKIKAIAGRVGDDVIKKAFFLYFLMKENAGFAVPVIAALGYLILPFDVVPDYLAVLGLADDIAVISALVALAKRKLESTDYDRLMAEATGKLYEIRNKKDQ